MDRSRLAREILENPVWKETFQQLGEEYYEAFRAADSDEDRRKIGIAHDILDDFESTLRLAVNQGVKQVGDNV